MGYELYNKAIITNNIDYYCLACDCFLETTQETYDHVQSTNHCEKISSVPYFDRYKYHYIRKFKKGYYCAFCNILLPTALKVESHISQEVHKQNRGNILLKSNDKKIIAYDTVLIKEAAWHGLNENVCSICDTEFDDEINHRKDSTHVLNLIQKTVKFGANDAIYRHIDKSTFHCLTCDKILSLKTLDSHFNDSEHRDLYETCKIKADDTATITENETKQTEKINPCVRHCENNDKENIAHIVNNLETYKRNNIDINIEIGTAFCRKCWIVVEYNCHDIDNHIKNHSVAEKSKARRYPTDAKNDSTEVNMNTSFDTMSEDMIVNKTVKDKSQNHEESEPYLDTKEKIITSEKEFKNDENPSLPSTSKNCAKTSGINSKVNTDEIIKIAKENNITFKCQNDNAFCCICQVRIPSSLKCLTEHIKGAQHNKNRAKHIETTKKERAYHLKRIATRKFIRSMKSAQSTFDCHVIINKDCLITDFSFFLMTKNDNTNFIKCLLCNTNLLYVPIFYKKIIYGHFQLHEPEFREIPVIKSIPLEFIREIRQGEFHCGFCNVLVTGWSAMEVHLNSSNHNEEKAKKYAHLSFFSNML